MKRLFWILPILLLLSCKEKTSYQSTIYVCTCQEREKLQNFVSDKVIKAANNMSDEEMEDVISQLERTGVRLYCHEKEVWIKPDTFGEVDYSKTKLDSCETVMGHY